MRDQTEKIRGFLHYLLIESNEGIIFLTQTELATKFTGNIIKAAKETGYYTPGSQGRNSKGRITFKKVTDDIVNIINEELKRIIIADRPKLDAVRAKRVNSLELENVPSSNEDVFSQLLIEQKKTNELLTELVSIWNK